uniref:Uncharacterized protein n=1 Tax=Cryptosporidium parvum TaxID=5807 RepID=F0X5M3_CRYPV
MDQICNFGLYFLKLFRTITCKLKEIKYINFNCQIFTKEC